MRRHAAKFFLVLVLALPGLAVLLVPHAGGQPVPRLNAAEWKTFPQRFDHWINEESVLRRTLLGAYAQLRFAVLGEFPTQQIIAGKGGRYFLAAHLAQGEPYRAIRLACGDNFVHHQLAIDELNRLHASGTRRGFDIKVLIVPSAPAVYRESLPGWLAERCDLAQLPTRQVMASPRLAPGMRAAMLFPLDEMRALPPQRPAYPLHYFHWVGPSPQLVSAMLEQRYWQRSLQPGSAVGLKFARLPSDVHHMHPGIHLQAEVGQPEFSGTRIEACDGAACFPELRTVMEKVGMVARYRNPAPGLGPRMVVVGDSFSPAIAPWLAQYHQEVVLVGSNAFFLLTHAERAALRAFMFRQGSGDNILYVYHDATLASLRIGYDLGLLSP